MAALFGANFSTQKQGSRKPDPASASFSQPQLHGAFKTVSTEALPLLNATIPIELRVTEITAARFRDSLNEFSSASLANDFPNSFLVSSLKIEFTLLPISRRQHAHLGLVVSFRRQTNAECQCLCFLPILSPCVYSPDFVGSQTPSTSAFSLLINLALRPSRAGLSSLPSASPLQLNCVPILHCGSHGRLFMTIHTSNFSRHHLPLYPSCHLCPKCLPFSG